MMQLQRLLPWVLCGWMGGTGAAGFADAAVDSLAVARADSLLRAVSTHARHLQREDDYGAAIEAYERAAALADSLHRPAIASKERVLAAALMVEVGRLEQGHAMLERARRDAQASGDPDVEAEVLYHLARGHQRMARFDEALENCEAIEALAPGLRARCRGRLVRSRVLQDMGQLRPALSLLEDMESDADSLGGSWPSLVLNARANVLTELGDLSQSVTRYERLREIARERDDPPRMAIAEGNLAGCYARMGRYQEAIDSYARCAAIFEQVGHTSNLALTHLNLANVHIRVGDLDAALREAQRAREVFEASGSTARANSARLTLVDILIERGELEEARAQAEASSRQPEALEGDVLRVLFSLGKLDALQGEHAAATRRMRAILARTEDSGELLQRGRALAVLGEVERADGSLDSAAVHLERAVATIGRLGSHRYAVNPLVEWGRCLRDLGRGDEALARFREAIEHAERIRWAAGAETGRWSVFGENLDPYAEAARSLLERGDAKAAFGMLESSRARTLIDRLTQLDVDLDARVPESLRRERREILARLDFAESRAGDAATRETALRSLESEYERVEGRIRGIQSPFRDLRRFTPATPEEVVARLGPDAMLLEYGFLEGAAWCVSVSSSGTKARKLAADVPERVERLGARLEREDRTAPLDLAATANLQHELFAELVGPELDAANGKIRTIVVAPDGPLWGLPFETLLTAPPPRALGAGALAELPYLFRSVDVHVVPSATVWLRLPEPPNDDAPSVLVADPAGASFASLPNARREAEDVAGALGARNVRVLVGEAASEERLEREPLRPLDCLHFATHSRVDEEHPQRTAVVLRQDEDPAEDGLLTLREIYALDLQARLVVLSTCSSAAGRRVRGEGPVALARAFLAVGARRTLVSLWPVQDRSTARFMAAFHRERANGASDATALRRARLQMLDSPRPAWRLPYHWAGFVLVGGP